jgi:uncharacterized protein
MTQVQRKLVVPGGSGFLGRIVAAWFTGHGWDVVVLSRNPRPDGPARTVRWDGRTAGEWAGELEGAEAVLNLAGRSVNCRYNAANRRQMMDSRTESTRVLGEAIAACARPPRVWLNSSTATIYRHTYEQPMDEEHGVIAATPEAKDAFSIEVAQAWEQAFADAPAGPARKVALRTAMVFGLGRGGVFEVLRRLTRLGLGGRMGHGRQYVSWIHEIDFCRALEWLIDHEELTGPVNLAAPNPLPNREMMRIFRRVYRMPVGLPASRWMLEAGAFVLRTETELIIKSRRVIPGRLLASGFEFLFPDLEKAISNLRSARSEKPAGSAA